MTQPQTTPLKATEPSAGMSLKQAAAEIDAHEKEAQERAQVYARVAAASMSDYERKMAFYEKLHNQAEDIGDGAQ